MLGLFLHLMVQAREEFGEALIFIDARVREVLVARRQFAAQQVLEVVNDFGMALHILVFYEVAKPEVSRDCSRALGSVPNSRMPVLWMRAVSRCIRIARVRIPTGQTAGCDQLRLAKSRYLPAPRSLFEIQGRNLVI